MRKTAGYLYKILSTVFIQTRNKDKFQNISCKKIYFANWFISNRIKK